MSSGAFLIKLWRIPIPEVIFMITEKVVVEIRELTIISSTVLLRFQNKYELEIMTGIVLINYKFGNLINQFFPIKLILS